MPAKLSIEFAKNLAVKNGGECISDTYVNGRTHLMWKCSQGHEWQASLMNVKNRNSWCPVCAKRVPHGIEVAQKLAEKHGGKCLSGEYKNSKGILLWECKNKHTWATPLSSIMHQKTWCAICSGRAKLSIEIACELAVANGGECLSTEYINSRFPLRWRCKEGHEWSTPLFNIKVSKHWCPGCSLSKFQRRCREVIECILGPCLNNHRPKFLQTKNVSSSLELDLYYPNLGLAIEVQGEQHRRRIPYFQETESEFHSQLQRDQLKRDLCEKNWVILAEVWFDEDPEIVIPEFLRSNQFI